MHSLFPSRALAILGLLGLASCFGQGPPVSFRRITDDDGGATSHISTDTPISDAGLELLTTDPHALIGVDPSHGPFSGGQTRLVRGNGFGAGLRIWFGPNEVAKKDILPIDPSRAQVVVPPGTVGAADVKTQIGGDTSTTRTLTAGYTYEDFYADPSSGPTSGGTVLHLFGQSSGWTDGTTVTVDDHPCEPVTVISPTEITCTTPQGTAGAKSITVTTADKVAVVREGFTYSDSDNGFRGGLSGSKLGSHLTVLALDVSTGNPVRGAYVLAGDDAEGGMTSLTDAAGRATFDAPTLGPTRSVTVAAKCYQPTTFVDVPVDTVTVYLLPVLSPACASGDGDIPGFRTVIVSTLEGELVWGDDGEFRSAAWRNVPPAAPNTSERRVAYVFRLSGDPNQAFSLPDVTEAIWSDAGGTVGFPFRFYTTLGNITLYALAGIEDRSTTPPKFTAYAMGIVKGVAASPGVTTSNIFIPIGIPLDHAITLQATPPVPGPRGPDRAAFSVAVEVEKGGYAILPTGAQSRTMPIDHTLSLVGFPALSGALAEASYVASGRAGTGPDIAAPLSLVGNFASKTESIGLDDFVPVPVLTYPAFGLAWDGRQVSVTFAGSARPVDLTVLQIQSGGGLVTWQVAAPGGTRTFKLPDLRSAFPAGALISGNVALSVYGAHIDKFDYSSVDYGHLAPSGFDAYSLDVFLAHVD